MRDLLPLAIALPLLGAFLLRPIGRTMPGLARLVGPLALMASLWVLAAATYGERPVSWTFGGFIAPLGIQFHGDGPGLLLGLAVPLLCLLLWPWQAPRPSRFVEQALYLLLAAAGVGLALSADLFNLFVFYELLAAASFGLGASGANPRAYAAVLRYLLLSAPGSALILIAVSLVYTATGTLNLAQLALVAPQALPPEEAGMAFALILLGFGVKAELFPVNAWAPEVYATAPPRVAALLAGVATKLAALVPLRLLLWVFPGTAALSLVWVLGIAGLVTAEVAAWRARDLRRLLAYSSIGQLGLVFIALAAAPQAGALPWIALALHHLLAKPALFLLTGGWHGGIDGLAGAARRAPLAGGLFVLLALSLVGVPPLPGFWAKYWLLTGLAAQAGPLPLLALTAILVATLIEAAYLLRVVLRLWAPADARSPFPPAPGDRLVAAVLGVALIATVPVMTPLSEALTGIAREALTPPSPPIPSTQGIESQ